MRPPQLPNIGAGLSYIAEPVATVATSLAGEVAGGLGALATLNPDNVEKIHHALTYQPQTGSGREGLADLGHLLSGAGELAMDTPYLGAAIRNFGESRDSLIDEGYPGLAAALNTAPAFLATVIAPEARAAGANIIRDVAKNAAAPRAVGPIARQKGFINPTAMAVPMGKVFKLSRGAKAATGALAGERAAQRVGSTLEKTHQATVAEKTATQEHEEGGGRNLLAAH
jgi:hypothetical protein